MNLFGTRQKQLLRFLTANAERETLDLSTTQQIIAMDKLLECAEVNLRTLCDLIRYQQLKEVGVVNSVEEFLQLLHPDDVRDIPKEDTD